MGLVRMLILGLRDGSSHQQDSLRNNLKIGKKSPLAYVIKIEAHFLIEYVVNIKLLCVCSVWNGFGLQQGVMQLSRPCDAGLDLEDFFLLSAVLLGDAGIFWTGAHQREVSHKKIEELRQFVQLAFPQK